MRGEPADVGSLLVEARELLARQRATIDQLRAGEREPVAVLGLGLRLPAGIETRSQLWAFWQAGGDAVTQIGDDRWDVAAYLDPEGGPGTTPVRSAALVSDHDAFDPGYFSISPREAAGMDPQQRMILEVTDRAFADAGIPIHCAARERVGAFVSTSSDDYLLQSADLRRRELFDPYTGTGTARAVAAGRLGHVFGFTGPVLHVDTACSSSLVALHLACRSLRDGECDLAVVAAANLIAAPQNLLLRNALDAVAPGGRSRPFAADAEGFGQGEGALAVVLQPLAAALAAGRRPLAAIHGSAVNHNGRGAGLTVPRRQAQHEVIVDALRSAGIDPDGVDLVEAHGTGTQLGDPIEVAGLAEVYGATGTVQLGSAKSNFGHLEAAAGLLSLAKVVLCLEHDRIPPTLHAADLNPEVAWDRTRFAVTTRLTDWPRRPGGRVAAVSSFGMAGTNAHLVVADPPEIPPPQRVSRQAQALLLSARSEWALRELVVAYADLLERAEPGTFADICASSAVGRDHHRVRLVAVAPNAAVAVDALRSWHRGELSEFVVAIEANAPKRIAVVRQHSSIPAVDAALAGLLPAGGYTVASAPPADLEREAVLVEAKPLRTGDERCDLIASALSDHTEQLAVALHLLGAQVDWIRVYPPGSFTPVRLPHHPFRRKRLWVARPADWFERRTATASIEERTSTMADTSVRTAETNGSALTAVTAVIADWVAELLGMEVGEVEHRRPLLELGADSLVFVELVSRVDATFGVEVVLRQLFEELLTVAALAEYVAHHGDTSAPSTIDVQQDYLRTLTDTYTRMTARSIAEHRLYLPVMCNNRRSASEIRQETAAFAAPLRVISSRGAHITDVDGNDYIDIAMGFGVNLFGHQAPFIVDAVRDQLATGMQLGPESAVAGEVARLLAELTGHDRVLFCNSGTEAVMTMMRLARARSSKRTIALFRNSYHGHFDSTLVNPAGVHDVSAVPMAIGIPPGLVDDVIVLPYADQRALAEIRARGSSLAAVLVEPVQNRRPDLQPGEFLRELREITRDNGVLLAFDEVLTGFRIHPGGAAAYFGVTPDVVSYAKVIGGGMPLGVVAGRVDVMDRVDGGTSAGGPPVTFTAGTYCRHPLAMASALAVLRVLHSDGERLSGELNQRTDHMRDELNTRFRELGVPFAVHNFGSFFRFSVSGNLSFAHQPLEMDYFNAAMLTKGVYIAEGGTCFLSTAHTDGDVQRVIDAATNSARELRDAGLLNLSTVDVSEPAPVFESAPAVESVPARVPVTTNHREPTEETTRAPVLSLSFFGDYPREANAGMYDVLRAAGIAADGRLDALWVPERHFHSFGGLSPNPSVLGAFLAGITSTIRIRAGSVVLPLHDPIRVAEEWAMVDNLSHGRVAVAFASGWQRNDFVLAREPFDHRREVMWRNIDTVRRLWRGEPIMAERNGISTEVRLHPLPWQAELPVWIAALGSERTFHAAGERGLSILTNLVGQTSEQLRSNIEVYRAARRAAGLVGAGHVTALVHTLVTSDGSAARLARMPLHRYLGSSVDLLSAVTGSAERQAFERLSDSDRTYLLDRAVDRYLEHNAMIGDLDAALGIARRIAGFGVDEIACFVDFGVDATELLAGVDQLVRLKELLESGSPKPEQMPITVYPPAPRTRASADLVGVVDVDDVTKAVRAAAAAPGIGLPNVHQVDLTLLGDVEQEEQAAEFYELDEAEQDGPGELIMISRSNGQVRLVAAMPGATPVSAEELLGGVVSALRFKDEDTGPPPDGELEAVVASRPNEQLMWLASEADPDTARACQVRTSLDVPAVIDIDALQDAVITVAGRHQALRSTIGADGETLLVHKELAPVVHVVDLSALAEADRDEELGHWYAEDAERIIDLAEGPLWRVSVLRLGERHSQLVLTAHHIIYDGTSEQILLDELAAAYGGAARNLPEPVDFVAWRRDHAGRSGEDGLRFWREHLAGAADSRAARLGAGAGDRLRTTIPAGTVAALRQVAAGAGCTPYVALLACYVVHRIRAGADGVAAVGVSTDPRDGAARRGLLGYLSNLLPLRIRLDPDAPVAAALPVVRAALLDAHEHQDVPYADILSAAARGPSGPLVPTCFNWDHRVPPRFGEHRASLVPDPASFVRFELSLNVVETDEPALTLEWDYALHAYDAEAMVRVAEDFAGVLDELVGHKESGVADTVHGRFAAVAARLPHVVVAHDRYSSITFGELDARSDRIAAGLLAAGLPAEPVLTIVGSLSVPMLAAMLGVLKAGAAFTVVPPSTSETVLAELVDACRSPLVIHIEGGATRANHVDLTALAESAPGRLPEVESAHAAYVITTSGSTGRPKPVIVEHRSLLSYLDALAERVELAAQGCLVVGSPAYDLCYTTLWSVLTRGGTLLLADEEAAVDAEALAELSARHPVDVLKIAPTHLDALLSTGIDAFLPRTHLLLGGEPLRWPTVHRVRASRPELTVWNHYGPTETTVGATMYQIGRPDPWEDRPTVPIGSAINGPVRVEDGELLVGGPGVAKAYLGLPEETATAFVWRTEPDDTRARWYRTGDLVAELADGSLEFIGRRDDQVSLRGHRVELGAVDAQLRAVPGVRAAATCVLGTGEAARLAAGVVLAGSTTPGQVRTTLAATVPGHLVPSTLVPMQRLPRMGSGKLDRTALAVAIDAAAPAGNGGGPTPEGRIAEMTGVWRDVLGLDSVGPEDDFFELGGHSIHAIKIVARVRKVFGRKVPIRVLFDCLTPRALLAHVTASPNAVQLQ